MFPRERISTDTETLRLCRHILILTDQNVIVIFLKRHARCYRGDPDSTFRLSVIDVWTDRQTDTAV